MRIAMTAAEKTLFEQFLSCSENYLEFGAGGSTFLASALVRRSVISVDSSPEWLERVRTACLEHKHPIQPVLVSVDVGEVKEWGWPRDETRRESWPDYHSAVWSHPESKDADFCFVDGRFRVACFLQSLRHTRQEAIIGIHDFNDRPQYHVVHEFAREIARSEALSFFVRKADFDDQRAAEVLDRHSFQPD